MLGRRSADGHPADGPAAAGRVGAAVAVGGRVVGALRSAPRVVLVAVVHLYQRVVSPLLGPRCRFYPSCSQYAVIAIERHGAVRGAGLAGWRLLRCNPWNSGGVDDVPPARGQDPPRASAHDHQH